MVAFAVPRPYRVANQRRVRWQNHPRNNVMDRVVAGVPGSDEPVDDVSGGYAESLEPLVVAFLANTQLEEEAAFQLHVRGHLRRETRLSKRFGRDPRTIREQAV